ncbi:MAG: FAD-dependent thymidylate synthase, partial [Candidatus Andersenbacteria bacterium]
LTQQRQYFSCQHGFDVPPELIAAGLDREFSQAIKQVEKVYAKIAKHDLDLAQYAVTLAHRMRFMQWTNLRECFWEIELRTIPEGHPDYRHIEQEKFRLLEKVYPLLAEYMRVNLGEYDFARRGQEEKIQEKLKELEALKL